MVPTQIQVFLPCLVFLCISVYYTHGVILRPDWYPYFQDDKQESGQVFQSRQIRNAPHNIQCPSDMTKFECYHELMAVWTRVLKKNRRDSIENGLSKLLSKLHPAFGDGTLVNFDSKYPPKFRDMPVENEKDREDLFDLK